MKREILMLTFINDITVNLYNASLTLNKIRKMINETRGSLRVVRSKKSNQAGNLLQETLKATVRIVF